MTVKMILNYPKVCVCKDKTVYVYFYLNDKRYRLYNGNKIGKKIFPNSYPINQRRGIAEQLAQEIYLHLINNDYCFRKELLKNELELFDLLLDKKLKEHLSDKYKSTISSIAKDLRPQVKAYKTIPIEFSNKYLSKYKNPTSFNTLRRHLNAFLSHLKQNGFPVEISSLKPKKQAEKLHKPIENISLLLDEVKSFNKNLFLCCLLTYGCLLRPHREVRELRWGDFSDDLKYISIGGDRVKSKRNRVVPVPEFIREQLSVGKKENNIFTNSPNEFNEDYFKTLWGRFKKVSKLIEQDQTLYSFRHSGAIEIFKRTGSITKLQKAMGHSSINVSLTYLRGLQIPELNEEDMPII